MDFIIKLVAVLPCLLLALTIHELCHGYAAYQLGDPTAKYAGRLTLNPLAHLDPVGTAILALTCLFGGPVFGWAKPVEFNPRNLRNPRRDSALIAAAGPAANLVMAFAAGLLFRFRLVEGLPVLLQLMAGSFVAVNVGLFLFNLIPIPPLDGSKILKALLPENAADQMEEWENQFARVIPFVLLFLLLTPFGSGIFSVAYRGLLNLVAGL